MAFNPNASQLDEQQIIQQVYDPVGNALNVNATVVTSIEDVAIKDPVSGNIMAVNSDGSINADVIISAASDSVSSWTKDGSGNSIGSTGGALNVNSVGSSTVSGTVNTNLNGLNNWTTAQYTVGTSSVQITPTPLTNRSSVSVKVVTTTSTDAVYIGTTSGVTTGTGYILFNGDSVQLDLTPSSTIYAIGTSAGQKVYSLELGS